MHFLEQYTDECPWDSDEPPLARRRAPKITPSTDLAAIAAENADPSEEISWGAMMTGSRQNFLERDRIRQEALGAVHEEIAQNEAASAAASAISRGGDAEPPIRGELTTRTCPHRSSMCLIYGRLFQAGLRSNKPVSL